MPEPQQESFPKRQVAYKVRISDILNADFKRDVFSAGYVKMNDSNVFRVNIIATVVHKSDLTSSYATTMLDDGNGRILLRSFENSAIFSKADVGDVVLVIGRIREFNNEKYIAPEIFKKIENMKWMELRNLEVDKIGAVSSYQRVDKKEPIGEELNLNDEIYSLIKILDGGSGVSFEDVINNSKNADAEKIINKMLENGDVFEITPGKLKVLE